jgi:hypothetical protein
MPQSGLCPQPDCELSTVAVTCELRWADRNAGLPCVAAGAHASTHAGTWACQLRAHRVFPSLLKSGEERI